jgi:predicted PurR-regulated permease PerM
MLVLPVAVWLEGKGLQRGWAALICDLLIIAFAISMGLVVFAQAKSIARDWPEVKARLRPQVESFQRSVEERTGITVEQQNAELGLDQLFRDDSASEAVAKSSEVQKEMNAPEEDSVVMSSAGDLLWESIRFLGTALIVFIYVFFFLLYRHKFTQTILLLVPKEEQDSTREAINKAGKVSQGYLFGRLLLIMCLIVLYSIGFSISGIDQAVLIAVIGGFLSLVPYVGNALALLLAVCMSFFSGGGLTEASMVVATYFVAQFFESYVLEPYLIGSRVDLNPVMVILAVILGSVVWGITGMAIAIPALGIIKVVCDHVPLLQPFAFLFGQERSPRRFFRGKAAKK